MIDMFFSGIVLIAAGGFISLFIKEKFKGFTLLFFAALGIIFILIPSFSVLINSQNINAQLNFSFPIQTVDIVIDPLSAVFIILFSVISFLAIIYTVGYFKPYLNNENTVGTHYLFLTLLILSMILVVTIQNALAFLIVWEIMSLSSFFLVVFENEKKETVKAGINYLIAMHIGVAFLLTGFIFLSIHTNSSMNFNVFKEYLEKNRETSNFIFILFFIGFGIKAGFVPLHTWLPKAHPASPSNVSGLMSGIMIKTGIYGILRILFLIGTPDVWTGYLILWISIFTALFGIMFAITQSDYKKLLAYSSIENIGLIGIGISIGMLGMAYKNDLMAILGLTGAILHIINHAFFKTLLFYSSGVVYQNTHTRNIEELGGLMKKMKYTSVFFLIASLSICALPPFNGFVSEFLIYFGFLKSISQDNLVLSVVSIIGIAVLSFIGCMALLCFTKIFGIIFLGSPRSEKAMNTKETGFWMILPMSIMAFFCLVLGLFPQIIINCIIPVLNMSGIESGPWLQGIIKTMNNISIYFASFILIFILFYLIRNLLLRKKKVSQARTWDCGYKAYSPRMQYTSSSFSRSFLTLINPLINKEYNIIKPEGIFPDQASFESKSNDIIENYFIDPVLKLINKFLRLFTWIQSGSTQKYIMYGLFFLVIIILVIIGFEVF